ncbi:prolipoprotein diacylglyceryl transferase family protein [Algoriphagus sp. CAU 1675]|uniref:prolipoprotein diacylglyceryl transferase family protein n=1 Tax=Algoriphagus sp. CAU 1675 TaxID=3032597 RepID=UPI0023DBC846|nr:prolipoprotein diacylglyceryl transferase family protein [Algoriphagus sp. CAU 1675]MDF2157091.1 prolipoprotein diacylglyceryl transferase [Algoriphagus sp. CAU 1675]
MKTGKTLLNKIFYALTFLVLIPALLWFWAKKTEDFINLPVIDSIGSGWFLIILGGLLMLWAMYSLKKFGKGLPMNAFPPKNFVTKGPYHFLRHPIYIGFGLFLTGYFIVTQSPSGLWFVTPITLLAMVALVLGYESIDLKERFPDESFRVLLDLPENREAPASTKDRLVALFWAALSLGASNYIIALLVGSSTPLFGKPWVLGSISENIQFLLLPTLLLLTMPFLLKRKDILRNWSYSGLIALAVSTFLALLYPKIGAQFFPIEQMPVYTVPIFMLLLSVKSAFQQDQRLGFLVGLITAGLLAIEVSFSRSAILHVFTSIFLFLIGGYYFQIWIFLKNTAEKIANSWQEWIFGKVRVINHGFYVGFGSFFGIALAGYLVGDAYSWAILMFAFVVIIFSALWAQIIEGSEKLKRPFGYYGALVGIIFASTVVWALGFDVWVIIGVISVVMPWVQGIGRFRCLVNGCCHGSKVPDPNIGIRYFHERSRVCGISHLKGELIHPTPLYSIIWLFWAGFILLSLWRNGFSPSFIFGSYLILNGIGRFVEEAYRGEVQTPILKGLRLYQWTAILSVLIGISMTMIPISVELNPSSFGWQTILSAISGGLFTAFAMGIDFPFSNARFSRLV